MVNDSPAPDAPESEIAPRPRPGFKSRRDDPLDVNAVPQMVAAAMGGALGVVALVASLLYFPTHMTTPILCGVAVLMITRGAYGAWKVGVAEPRLQTVARICVWGLPIATVVAFVAGAVLGPGGLAPDWAVIFGNPPPPPGPPTVTFER
jgi:hypothetical protein